MQSASERSSPSEDDKVRLLRVPGTYPEPTGDVAVIETHHAWVFLTDRHAYKMKKPVRYRHFEVSSLSDRRRLCEEELRLNRRLAAETYLGVVPLVIDDGRVRLEAEGRVIEWLIKMRRLPEERMLDVAVAAGSVTSNDIRRVLEKLLDFYESAPRCRVGEHGYAAHLAAELEAARTELLNCRFGLAAARVNGIVDRQLGLIETNAALLAGRRQGGFVVEAHGDLRPEHVCLMPGSNPQIIDCLEFDRDLRCLDRVEELAYFGLESRMLGHGWIEEQCMKWYRANSGDRVAPHLWHLYAARRATVRAMLSAWHSLDGDADGTWLAGADAYLGMAVVYLDAVNDD